MAKVSTSSRPRGAQFSKLSATAWIVIAYAIALLAAGKVADSLRAAPPWWIILWADLAGTFVILLFSRLFRNSSFYDAYWSVAPMVIAPYLALREADPGVNEVRQILVVTLVWLWGARLTYNWYRQWRGLGHEDWRYVALRQATGDGYVIIDVLGIHFFPTVQVYLGCIPLFMALCHGSAPLGVLDAAAVLVTGGSIYLEARADRELYDFVQARKKPGEIMDRGLWRYSRHPNYFGEVGFWWGLALFGYAAAPDFLYNGVGALSITLMFRFVSVPMLEARSLSRRPGYADHARRVSALLPWFPKAER